MLQLKIQCRHDELDAFFLKNCLAQTPALLHFPFLVFIRKDYELEIVIIREINNLMTFSDDTQVMKQWPGAKRSDYFTFTIGQLREYYKRALGKAQDEKGWQF